MSLKNYNTEELQAEIDRRNQSKASTPQPLENLDYTHLTKMCNAYIADVEKYGLDGVIDDWREYIFEAAIETVYGDNVWKWINEHG